MIHQCPQLTGSQFTQNSQTGQFVDESIHSTGLNVLQKMHSTFYFQKLHS